MKKFFTLIAFTCALVPALQSMEYSPEQMFQKEESFELKSLKRSREVIDLTNDAMDPLVTKKQKTEENNVASNGLAKKIVYGNPVAKQTTLNFFVGCKPQFVQSIDKIKFKPINPKKSKDNPFICLECNTDFSTERSLASHKGAHTAMKRAKKISAARYKEEKNIIKFKNAQLK